jgi:dolichol-phosphate mannosyltransferase
LIAQLRFVLIGRFLRRINNEDDWRAKMTQFRDLQLGVVTPMANERNTAERFVVEVWQHCSAFQFRHTTHHVVFDRTCTDGTIDLLRGLQVNFPHLQIIYAPENRNVVDAYLRGYHAAFEQGAEWILEIDAGFSHAPSEISKLLNTMAEGYDCVFGSRFCKGGKMIGVPAKRWITSFGGTIISNLLLGTRLSDMTSGFELFKREALEAILAKGIVSRGPFFQTEIKAFARRFKVCEVPITYTSPSHHLGLDSFKDAFRGLFRLFRLRLNHQL